MSFIIIPATPSVSAVTLLSTVTASNSTTVDVESTFDSTYDAYLIIASGVTSQNNNVQFKSLMKLSGNYVTTSTYLWLSDTSSSKFGDSATGSVLTDTEIRISNGSTGNSAADSLDFQLSVYNPSSTALSKIINWEGVTLLTTAPGPNVTTVSGVASNSGTGALTGIRFYFSAGNIVAGKFRLYGIAN